MISFILYGGEADFKLKLPQCRYSRAALFLKRLVVRARQRRCTHI